METYEMWPICETFAAFVQSYVKIPLNEIYPYHGTKKRCRKYSRPGPFRKSHCVPVETDWELFQEGDLQGTGIKTIHYNPYNFLPSSDNDRCEIKVPDGKARYYFCELDYYQYPSIGYMVIQYNDGLKCGWGGWSGGTEYMYAAWFQKFWIASNTIFWVYSPKLPSHYKIWRTRNGEFSGCYPVAPGHGHD